MSIEEAEYILNEAVITQASINSYTYISAEEINQAIEKILEEKASNEIKIKQLEQQLINEKQELNKLINKENTKKENFAISIHTNKLINLKKIIKYLKKVVKPVFLLEK